MTPPESTPAPPPPSEPAAGSAAKRLARSAGVVGAATLTSRLLGLVRDQVLAYLFGAGNAMDAFNVATRIPNLLRDLFAEGAMSAAFVPTFMRRLTHAGRVEAWRLGNQLLNALVVVTGAFVLAGMLFAEPLVRLLAGSYAEVPGKLELTVFLTRLLLPFLTLVAVAAALMGMLNSLNRFFVPALSPAMYNVGIILSGALLVPLMPGLGLDPIVAIAIGALLGGVGQVALQVPALHREGFRYRAALDPADPGLRRILRLMGPGTLAGASVQINLLVNMVLATGQGTGAVSWLGYAFRVMYLPIGLFGVSIASATLPVVSRHAAREDIDGIRDAVSRALRLMLVVNVPATVGLIALGVPVVQLIFERGSFTPEDTAATAAALLFYAPGLAGYSAVRIAVPCFYALGSSVTPTTDQHGRRDPEHRAQSAARGSHGIPRAGARRLDRGPGQRDHPPRGAAAAAARSRSAPGARGLRQDRGRLGGHGSGGLDDARADAGSLARRGARHAPGQGLHEHRGRRRRAGRGCR